MVLEGLVSRTPDGKTLRVREVWEDNLDAEMAIIRSVVDTHRYLAMDTEFPGVIVKPIGPFKTQGEFQYATIRKNVDMLKIIQLGLAFTDQDGFLPEHNGELCVWQFNFREFNMASDLYSPESLELLVKSGIDFQANVDRGITVERFAELLMTSGVVLNSRVQWITFHAGYDFGYLIKLMTCDALPKKEKEFEELIRLYFPCVWDIKYMMGKKNLYGGLQKVATQLGVDRIGPQHQAGSDSLLTVATFMKLLKTHVNGLEEANGFQGVLHHLGEDGERPLVSER